MSKVFNGIPYDYISDNDYISLNKLRRRNSSKSNHSKYKIIITSDRCDYDDLEELANHPEKGRRVCTLYFSKLSELKLIVNSFEGLFYRLFIFSNRYNNPEKIGYGIVNSQIQEDLEEYLWLKMHSMYPSGMADLN